MGIVGLLAVVLTVQAGTIREIDENEDGVADQWIEDIGDERFRVSKDRDFDGTADYSLIYDKNGKRIYEELDFNFDTQMDDFYFYIADVLDHRTVDTNFDGEVDLWVFLDEGVYVRKIERDLDYDGEIDYVKEYGPPELQNR
jgi:hypothetical protein